ncbi:transglycosylase SLT domain-containing protein [Acetobacter okinawensis]|nr:transglycosylase SLT domain-containing protein [Acetobacter okinawensis]
MPLLPSCGHIVANYYNVPTARVETIIAHSSNRGIGPMGIDAGWLPILERAGFDTGLVQSDACMNIAAGIWILARAGAGNARGTKTDGHGAHSSLPTPSAPLSGSLRSCASEAARRYKIAEPLFIALLMTEAGRPGQIVRNSNGTYDMGPAQINSTHLPELAAMGITREQVIQDGCLNIQIGAWILARELDGSSPSDAAGFWKRVGNYNSRTPKYNVEYQKKVWRNVVATAQSGMLHPRSGAGGS